MSADEPRTMTGQWFYRGNAIRGFEAKLARTIRAIEDEAASAERERMRAMRHDYQTMPHAQFPEKWADWKDYEEVLPRTCDCRDCRLWRSGS